MILYGSSLPAGSLAMYWQADPPASSHYVPRSFGGSSCDPAQNPLKADSSFLERSCRMCLS